MKMLYVYCGSLSKILQLLTVQKNSTGRWAGGFWSSKEYVKISLDRLSQLFPHELAELVTLHQPVLPN